MKKLMQKWTALLLALLMTLSLAACGSVDEETVQLGLDVLDAVLTEMEEQEAEEELPEAAGEGAPETLEQEAAELSTPEALPDAPEELLTLPEDGSYTTKEDVALYIYLYGGLPDNFITKKEARALGWSKGSLEPYAPGMCIGGGHGDAATLPSRTGQIQIGLLGQIGLHNRRTENIFTEIIGDFHRSTLLFLGFGVSLLHFTEKIKRQSGFLWC